MNTEAPKVAAPAPRFRPRPWTALLTVQDVEIWIDEHNRSLMEHIGPQETGVGVCFTLAGGGDIYMQTTADAVILDVEADAQWVAPLIMAATGSAMPAGQVWILPDDKLVQLIVGLSSLVASTTLVAGHNFTGRVNKLPLRR
ncbi:hypothetical protein KY495_19215 [Massilia sp. PAMC28688]|uniref:hypothetical protein n=1 Tax=Massilia sp. PAMC28688 TaxID=2861283 RepID=UPI001C62C149|nr:hypothetical protein [Massilia sp. PAMC28688]QYF92825.1 hypothetical protein KY495_19215 [Massilia sp. PAMC28688]